jgi:hypothetical protein
VPLKIVIVGMGEVHVSKSAQVHLQPSQKSIRMNNLVAVLPFFCITPKVLVPLKLMPLCLVLFVLNTFSLLCFDEIQGILHWPKSNCSKFNQAYRKWIIFMMSNEHN